MNTNSKNLNPVDVARDPVASRLAEIDPTILVDELPELTEEQKALIASRPASFIDDLVAATENYPDSVRSWIVSEFQEVVDE